MNETREYRLENRDATVLFRLLEESPQPAPGNDPDLWIIWSPGGRRTDSSDTVSIRGKHPRREELNVDRGLCLGLDRNGADPGPALLSGREILVSEEVSRAFAACYEILRQEETEALQAPAHALWVGLERYLGQLITRLQRLPGRSLEHRLGILTRLEAARRLLENDLKSNRCVTEAAERASMSRSHFIRTFKACYGETPKQVRISRRLRMAKRLLRHSRLSVAEIAVQTGFGNRCAFHRLFRDRVGETPIEYRKRGAV